MTPASSNDEGSNAIDDAVVDDEGKLLEDGYGSNEYEDEEEEYETSYSKLAAAATSSSSRGNRRKRGGYGGGRSSSVLETLGTSSPSEEGVILPSATNNDDTALFEAMMGADDDLPEEAVGRRGQPDIFLETQDDHEDENDEGGSGRDDEDDDVAADETDDVDAAGEVAGSSDDGEQEKDDGEEDEEDEFPQSEASGYGFSQGEVLAQKVVAAVDGSNAKEQSAETDKGADGGKAADEIARGEFSEKKGNEAGNEKDGGEPKDEFDREETGASVPDPSPGEVLRLVDSIFVDADKEAVTVGDVLRSVAKQYGWSKKDAKKRKEFIKGRLIALMQGNATPVEEEEGGERAEKKGGGKKSKKQWKAEPEQEQSVEEEAERPFEGDYESEHYAGNDSSSDYDEARPRKGNKPKKSKVTFRNDSESDADDDFEVPRSKKKRSSKNGKKGRMAKHLRDSHTRSRLRQLEEARIRREELGHLADDAHATATAAGKKGPTAGANEEEDEETAVRAAEGTRLSEEDRQRALAIAARFDTDGEELRAKRAEDRVGLIGRLRARRLEVVGAGAVEVEVDVRRELFAKARDPTKVGLDLKGKERMEKEETGRESNEETCITLSLSECSLAANASKEEAASDQLMERLVQSSDMVDLEDDDDSSTDGDDLEIVVPSSSKEKGPAASVWVTAAPAKPYSKMGTKVKKSSAADLLFRPEHMPCVPQNSSKQATNPRAALRNALKARAVRAGNRWLARELGYKTEDDHIRDCIDAKDKKQRQILMLERQATLCGASGDGRDAVDEDAKTELVDEAGDCEEEENEEMAVARELEQLDAGVDGDRIRQGKDSEHGQVSEAGLDPVQKALAKENIDTSEQKKIQESPNDGRKDRCTDYPDVDDTKLEDYVPIQSGSGKPLVGSVVTPLQGQAEAMLKIDNTEGVLGMADNAPAEPCANSVRHVTEESYTANREPNQDMPVSPQSSNTNVKVRNDRGSLVKDNPSQTNSSEEALCSPSNGQPSVGKQIASKKPKNSAWQAMLRKEKEVLIKQKKLQKKGGGLVEGEAEEEEEEEHGIAGLEDFGFAIEKKDDDDEDDADGDADEDDLDHVVDELSDGEGDEEAGEVARKRLERAEEKERHKEIVRRMREGYDGRRGGIASGAGGARGTLRFDQLVAADGREDARRLGLLNDDELNSDEEGGEGEKDDKKGDDEDDDEAVLLDKMLKERFLNRAEDDTMRENFTDDEESEAEADGEDQNKSDNEEEDREQDRLAKYFAKRARRNRVLEEFEGDSQFSRSRLIDEDVSMQQDLKMMKTSFCRKRNVEGSNLDSKENNCTSKKPRPSFDGLKKNSFLSQEGSSLSVALMASRAAAGRKRKTTFLSCVGKQNKKATSFFSCQTSSSSSSKSVSLNHVLFTAGDNSQSVTSHLDLSGSNSFLGIVNKCGGHRARGRDAVKTLSRGSSLWSKVCSKNFQAN